MYFCICMTVKNINKNKTFKLEFWKFSYHQSEIRHVMEAKKPQISEFASAWNSFLHSSLSAYVTEKILDCGR